MLTVLRLTADYSLIIGVILPEKGMLVNRNRAKPRVIFTNILFCQRNLLNKS